MEVYEVVHPSVPAELEGVTILHLTDFHTRRGSPWTGALERVAGWMAGHEVDVVAFTGDYPDRPADEGAAVGVVERLAGAARARLGVFGVFGNHDGPGVRRLLRERVRGVRWLDNEEVVAGGMRIVGASFPEDLVGASVRGGGRTGGGFRLGLVHYPTEVYTAAALGVDVVLAGHTHGGQVRWSPSVTPHTSSDLPSGYASGVYALGGTVLCVSRGMGEAVARVRVRCAAQAGVYVLRRGALPAGEGLRVVRRW